jgi:hypothetical protein
MGARAVIVIDVRDQDPPQIPLVNHDHMVKTYLDPTSAQGCLSMLKSVAHIYPAFCRGDS